MTDPLDVLITQEWVDENLISSMAICKELRISRPALLYAFQNNGFPKPLEIAYTYIWQRSVAQPAMDEWADRLAHRRRNSG